MHKKIKIEQLRPGMFIHSLNCGWMHHPFISGQIKINSDKDIEKIAECGIKEVYIDTDKGLDIEYAPTEAEVKQEIQAGMKKISALKPGNENRVPFNEEVIRAKEIKKEAKQTVQNIMEEVRLGKQVQMHRVDHVVNEMINSIFRNKDALMCLGMIKQKDDYTFFHSLSVCVLMLSFGKYFGYSPELIHTIGVGGLLHDIGKMKVPVNLLNKKEPLSDVEFRMLKEHVEYSDLIVSQVPGIPETSVLVASQHHERLDGKGYPKGLRGEDISMYGRMAAIVDVYDAMTSRRCYQDAMEPAEVLRKIFEWRKLYFDEGMVQHFIRCVGIYPVGTLVSLESGLLGVVIESSAQNLLQPVVRIMYNTNSGRFITPYVADISRGTERIEGYESPSQWKIDPQDYLS